MRIVFDPDFDGGCWPGPLRSHPGKNTVLGEAWVGPFLFQKSLETALGLGGLVASHSERIISLAKAVRSREGFWSLSAEKDTIGVARTLLRWIDRLKMHGWNGQALPLSENTARLNDLAALLPSIPPGTPDDLNAISAALETRRPDIETIETCEPVDRLPPLWREIFSKLQAHGVNVKLRASIDMLLKARSPSSPATGSDLRRALIKDFNPAGDGSLLLFRPRNPLDAAESVAAWLSVQGGLSDTVIISPDVSLDDALRRFGLPVTGAREFAKDEPSLQILPLVIAMGWEPPDPQRAIELLMLENGPIPGSIARNLRSALREWPSVGSPEWNEAIKRGLEKISVSSRREEIRERLNSIFRSVAKIYSTYPAAELKLRARTVKKWATARRHAAASSGTGTHVSVVHLEKLDAVIAQCASFEKLIELSGFESFTETQLLKLSLEISDSLHSTRRYEPQAGLASVPLPSAIVDAARRIVWWDFSIESLPPPFSLPISQVELAALESVGVTLTSAFDLASDDDRRARRPFAFAAETLLLVSPRFGHDGEERHHHPLWDEVCANCAKRVSISLIELTCLPPPQSLPMRTAPLLPLPSPKRSWSVPGNLVSTPSQHSPSSLGDLIGCSFKWALNKLGCLREPEIISPKEINALVGTLSHFIIGEVLDPNRPDRPADREDARDKAEKIFDSLGPKLAAPIFLPGAPVQQAMCRKATADAAGELFEILRKARLPVAFIEHSASAQAGDITIHGRLDLVAGEPKAAPVIIDLKWKGDNFHLNKLREGTAHQLAAYAFIMKKDMTLPPVAYFIIRSGRLIAHAESVSPESPFVNAGIEAVFVDSPPLDKTWDALLATTLDRLKSIQEGLFESPAVESAASAEPDNTDDPDDTAPHIASPPKKDALNENGRLDLTPPCKFCHYGALCGLIWKDA